MKESEEGWEERSGTDTVGETDKQIQKDREREREEKRD